jgi:predicted ester cyclase
MSVDDNKAIARRYIEELWNARDLAIAEELFSPNYTIHQAGQSIPANPGFLRQSISAILTAFPDFQMSIGQVIAEGDLVVVNWTNRGTQTGEFQVPGQPGLPASGREVTFTESATFRIADSKVAEVWYVSDRLTMMQQLGAISSAGPR